MHGPLSFSQERLWSLWRQQPSGLAQIRPWAVRLRGELDVPSLETALRHLVARHAILRMRFGEENGVAYQEEIPGFEVILPTAAMSQAQSNESLEQWIATRLARPFDLRREPCFRPELLRLDEQDHVLLLTTHEIGFDADSEEILAEEIEQAYVANRMEGRVVAGAPNLQYAEFAARERRETVLSGAFQRDLDYWGYEFGAPDFETQLDTDPWAVGGAGGRVGRSRVTLDRATSIALQELCARNQIRPLVLLAASWSILLARIGRNESVTFGHQSTCRNQLELKAVIGLFSDVLPMQVGVEPEMTLDNLLEQVRRKMDAGEEHQEIPFGRIAALLRPAESSEPSDFFNTLVSYREASLRSLCLPGLDSERLEIDPLEPQFDFALEGSLEGGFFNLQGVYARDRQSERRAMTLIDQVGFLLGQIGEKQQGAIGRLSLVTKRQRTSLPDLAKKIEKPRLPTVVDTFLEQARRTPHAPAVLEAGRSVSYLALEQQAAEEARAFAEAGVAAGDRIVLSGPRCAGRIAGMIGAWLIGAVVVPLDERLTFEQRASVLATSKASVLARYSDLGLCWASDYLPAWKVLKRPTRKSQQAAQLNSVAVRQQVESVTPAGLRRDAAYMLSTSGTTGAPKSILGSHQALSHFVRWQIAQFGLGVGDRCGLVNNLAFDMSFRDFLTPLGCGGSVCIPDEVAVLSSGNVFAWLEKMEVTFLHMVPTIAQWWMDVDQGRSTLASLQWAFFGGEALTKDIVSRWRTTYPLAGPLVNLYGPSETTMIKTWYRVPDRPVAGVQPIGRPLPNTQVVILSDDGSRCGLEEPGEIVIRTPFQTYGYVDLAEGVSSGFSANPHTSDPEDQLYRTGDLGRLCSSGTLEFLGRNDDEVKIRGMKVLLSEVETAILAAAGAKSCAVLARREPAGEVHLVAYVVPDGGHLDVSALRLRLQQVLPPNMHPSQFIVLESMPLTDNGKLDRRALPAPAAGFDRSRPPRVAADDLERDLIRIWERVLNVGKIGVDDNFFEMGGHSLLALQLFAGIERLTGRKMPVTLLFQAPTVSALAQRIREGGLGEPKSPLVAIQPYGDKPPIFWVHAAGGHVISYRNLAMSLGSEQPFYALQGGHPHHAREFRTVEQLAADYLEAICERFPEGPYHLGGLSFGGIVAWEMAQQLIGLGEKVGFLGVLDTRAPGSFLASRRLDLGFELRQRFEFHLGQLALRPVRRWPGYLVQGSRRLAARRTAGWIGQLSPRLAKSLAPVGWPLWLEQEEAKEARDRYRMRPYSGKLTLFRAQSQPRWAEDPYLGWREFITGEIDVRQVPGTHASMISSPNLEILAREIRSALAGVG